MASVLAFIWSLRSMRDRYMEGACRKLAEPPPHKLRRQIGPSLNRRPNDEGGLGDGIVGKPHWMKPAVLIRFCWTLKLMVEELPHRLACPFFNSSRIGGLDGGWLLPLGGPRCAPLD